MICNICTTTMNQVFNTKILNKYNIDYFQCPKCKFLCTEKPFWIEEAYSESINITDTGLIGRNVSLAKIVSILCYYIFKDQKYLDFGGGYGILTRMLRDVGFDFYWSDIYTQNLFAKGFEYNENDKIELVTSFEAFEHFVDSSTEIEQLLKISNNVFFSTELYQSKYIPKVEEWWYYSVEHGQHISFYSIETLEYIASKYNLYLYSNKKDLHLFAKEKSFKMKIIFKLFNNSTFMRLLREFIYLYIKFVKRSKTFDDMLFLKDR